MSLTRRALLLAAPASVVFTRSAMAQSTSATGLVLVGASWCPVCKQAAPMLALFAERHAIPVIVASHDQRPIEPFAHFVDGRTHPLAAGVTAYPTTFVFSSVADGVVGGIEGYRDPQWYFTNLLALVRAAEGLT